MNDFSKASKLFFTILFADDISVFLEGKEYTKLVEILNEELNKITIWLNANKLMINVKKTHYMVFHRAKIKTLGTDVIMQNTSIQCVKSTQFLGVIMDDHITNDIILNDEWSQTESGEHFILIDDISEGSRIIVFGTDDSLRRLCASDIVSMDGTFKVNTQIIFRSTSENSEEMHQNYFLFGIFSSLRATISEIKYFKL